MNATQERNQKKGKGPLWLEALGDKAKKRYEKLGLPNRKWEAWKYLHLDPAVKTFGLDSIGPFSLIQQGTEGLVEERERQMMRHQFLSKEEKHRLVFHNGFFMRGFSSAPAANGLWVQDFETGLERHPEKVKKFLGVHLEEETNPFAALNLARFAQLKQGAFVFIPSNQQVQEPIHLLWTSFSSEKLMEHPHILVVLEDGATASLVLSQHYGGSADYLANLGMEIFLGKEARLEVTLSQDQSAGVYHLFSARARLREASKLTWTSFTQGSRWTRQEIFVDLEGENAQCALRGLSILSGPSQLFSHATVNHRVGSCLSRQIFKNILADNAVAESNSFVHVFGGAQKSDSHQMSRNLLLSPTAHGYSRPRLQIHADDVQAAHGSATGPLNPQELFYLRSRGLSAEDAELVLTQGFADEILHQIRPLVLRGRIQIEAHRKLQQITGRKS